MKGKGLDYKQYNYCVLCDEKYPKAITRQDATTLLITPEEKEKEPNEPSQVDLRIAEENVSAIWPMCFLVFFPIHQGSKESLS